MVFKIYVGLRIIYVYSAVHWCSKAMWSKYNLNNFEKHIIIHKSWNEYYMQLKLKNKKVNIKLAVLWIRTEPVEFVSSEHFGTETNFSSTLCKHHEVIFNLFDSGNL